jgi:D-3-phosphoglycerate dehydrogenase
MERRLVITAANMIKVLGLLGEELESLGWDVSSASPTGQFFTCKELLKLSAGANAMIIGDDQATKEFFEGKASKLGLLVKWGVGTDSIDLVAAKQAGVEVFNTPGVFGAEVADLAMGYVLSLARHIVQVHDAVRDLQWIKPSGLSLVGKTLSIIGFGDVGSNLATRATAFGMKIIYYDPFVLNSNYPTCSIEEIFAEGDFVVLTCPSTDQTRGIVSRANLKLMKKNSFLINVSRGDLVVEEDLADALNSGQIAGVALDVFNVEPLPESSTLRSCKNILFGAHNGSNTSEAVFRASKKAIEIVADWQSREGL